MKAGEEPLLMWLGNAKHLPTMDLTSESDPFIVMELLTASGVVKNAAKWPVKWDSNHPTWNSCRVLGKAPASGGGLRVRLTLYDYNETAIGISGQTNDLIGTAEVGLSELRAGAAPSTLPVQLKLSKLQHARNSITSPSRASDPVITLARWPPEAVPPPRKTVYLVRHGESVWNAAQADKNVVAMLSEVDHPLNETGRRQAEGLAAHLVAGGGDAAEVMKAQLVVCSPLTRAIQTCLVALGPLLASGAHRVQLNPNAREKRNFGGKDSSGKHIGEAISVAMEQAMRELFPEAEAKAEELLRPRLDLELVQTQWWLGSKEDGSHVVERTAELLSQLRYCEAQSIVLVGHSHYFRELFRQFMPDAVAMSAAQNPYGDALRQKKLSNCGIAAVEMDWAAEPDRPVAKVRLLFDTALVD